MLHRWPDAPPDVAFLRFPHRHMFKFEVELRVWHCDRDIEFILLKRELQARVEAKYAELAKGLFDWIAEAKKLVLESTDQLSMQMPIVLAPSWSCEKWSEWLFDQLYNEGQQPIAVLCSEDGENGAVARRPIA